MKYIAAFIALFSAVQMSVAQNVPDNAKISEQILDIDSPYYYPSLMLRYLGGDMALTVDEYHYLYYGYAFQEDYKPLEPVAGTEGILGVFERNPQPGADEAKEIIYYANEVMERDPFSPSNINYLTYAYGILGDTLNERINADRFIKILATIESSGTGLTDKSPWHILWFTHANDIVASKGLEIRERRIVSRSEEYIDLQKNDLGIKGYYFDFSRIYWKRPDQIPSRTGRQGFKLNGIPIKK